MCFNGGLDTTGVSDLPSAHGHKETRTNQGSRIIYITDKPVPQHPLRNVQRTTFGLLVKASLLRLTGWFHIHLFFLFI